ncbi:hypothetical protein ABB37_00166 [Leptomonas pyrrhocoris]|uniref:Uncharacterized protein n=1 Tax=Leptomonas pyrrhocoris TaxID=157538 RepID=A0A0N0DZY9_LEPPY|nr:hypothetical protein ABB37_00166 [Leptomonas pyrrhocoris]KPA85828.1 hypothetical protein ABB37_00166 [Leptomonas pyrrhocoris]|eukprot:XP_015664267.1 hypothetical protein ABB37_00166 [Leptomonas pyrrhocoris]
MTQLDTFQPSDDALLDALLDQLTIDSDADLSVVLTRIDALHTAHTTRAKVEQRQTEQQRQRSADLQEKWADVISRMPPDISAVDALTSECTQYFQDLLNAADHARTRNGWRASGAVAPAAHVPGLATRTLLPLLLHLSQVSSTPEKGESDPSAETTRLLRRAYLHLLPSALRAAAPPASPAVTAFDLPSPTLKETNAVAWYGRYASDPVTEQLLSPYMSVTVAPLERELRYHFCAGRETAALHEPQHFFAFLSDCVERQRSIHKDSWVDVSSLPQAPSSSSPTPTFVQTSLASLLHLLDHLGQLAFSAAAVVAFQSCYGWQPHSPLWRSKDYVVVTINAILDFVARAEGRLCREATELLLEHLLTEEVVLSYARAGEEMANAALENGAARLWRRSFLALNAPCTPSSLYTCSLHMVRALEAFLRRLLNTLFVVESTYAALLWRKTVEPVLSHFLEVVEAHAVAALDSAEVEDRREGHSSWSTVLQLQWCVSSVQVVATAAEDWLGMLRESVTSTSSAAGAATSVNDREGKSSRNGSVLATSDALDGLALFRDKLARRAAEQAKALTRQLCTHKSADSAQAASLLHSLDVFLQQLETLPEGSSRYVMQAVIQDVMHDFLPQEQQAGLAAFTSRSGLPCVTRLLAA